MNTRKDIESNILKCAQMVSRLESELSTLEGKGKDLEKQAIADLMEGKNTSAVQTQVETQGKLEVTRLTLAVAQQRLAQARQELTDLDLAEQGQHWITAEAELWKRLDTMQDALGENGLNTQLAVMLELLNGARPYARHIMDGEMHATSILRACVEVSKALNTAWQAIEALNSNRPTPKQRAAQTGDSIPGFGKTLHR